MQPAQKPIQTAPNGQLVKLTRSSRRATLREPASVFPDERSQFDRQYGLTSSRLYTGEEVCKVLRISLDCFRKLCNSGILPYHDVARKKLVQGCFVIKYLQNSLKNR